MRRVEPAVRARRINCGADERIHVALDLQNLVGSERRDGRLATAIEAVVEAVRCVGERGTLMGGVAVCDRDLQSRSAWALHGVRVRVHTPESDGPDSADLVLIEYLRSALPETATTVVIGSGDHIFAPVARDLMDAEIRVRLLARPGSVSHELYRSAHDYTPLYIPTALGAAA